MHGYAGIIKSNTKSIATVFLFSSNQDVFMIDGNQLVLNWSGILDFEKQPFINISVLTTDSAGSPYSKSHQVKLNKPTIRE